MSTGFKEALVRRRVAYRFAKKLAFSKFVKARKTQGLYGDHNNKWNCCDEDFIDVTDIHRHVSKFHKDELANLTENIIENGDENATYAPLKNKAKRRSNVLSTEVGSICGLPETFSASDEFPWLPVYDGNVTECDPKEGKVILFYCYREITSTEHVKSWQEALCRRLSLTGKVRVASEGLNATVGGNHAAIDVYIESVRKHPLFHHLTVDDFKVSNGSASDFPDGLKVGIYREAVPMGVDTDRVSYKEAGVHLTPEEFHEAVTEHDQNPNSKAVFVDCRNFYESKIGHFTGAVCPDIRKFSYWPEYVDQNKALFQDKKVYMYCTGGIRCERGSAYLKSQGISQEVYQLKGGIHKYIEHYPDGYFRGKMFVFDDRYHLKANDDVLSKCQYCDEPYDLYKPCSSPHCHQLVLSCDKCTEQELTACCRTCQSYITTGKHREECECTLQRPRVPVEHTHTLDSNKQS